MNIQTADIVLQISTMLYFTSMAGYLIFLFNRKSGWQKTAFYLIVAAIVFHCISIIISALIIRQFPVQNLLQSLSIAAFLLGCMFLIFHYKFDLKILGLFASILLSVTMLTVLILPEALVEKNSALTGFWLYSHIILIFAGYAAMSLACGIGILYLLQEKGIKEKTPGFFFRRLPSLDLLDNAGYNCITTGFVLLTIGLLTGFIYAKTIWGRFWGWDIKEIFSAGTWIIYASLLHLRLYSGWRGKKSAIMTIIGFLLIIFTFLGVNLLLGGHHQPFTK